MSEIFCAAMRWSLALVGALAGYFGKWNTVLTCLIVVNGIDYATGLLCAWRGISPKTAQGKLSSKAGFDGLAKKAFIWLVILLTTCLDKLVGGGSATFQTAAAFYYIANEGLSILENGALMGLPVPSFIKDALEVLLVKSGKEGDALAKTEPEKLAPDDTKPDKEEV